VGDGSAHLIKELNTIMAGLSCGMPSLLAWNIIKELADYFAICSDDVAFKGMKICGNPIKGDQKIVSGESGAVPIGFLHAICTNNDYDHIKKELNLNERSNVLFYSTEGDTDPDLYERVLSLE
jgi:diaminopropionate ammonia-lyase